MQPEIPSPQDTSMSSSEPIPAANAAPIEPTPVQELVRQEPSPIQKITPKKRNTAAIVLGVVAFLLLAAVIGLGVWGYTLNTKLAATQQQLKTLQGEHSQLQTDFSSLTTEKEKLTSDLAQTKTDLDKTNDDLATAQADLKKAKDENKGIEAQVSKSTKYADILYSWFTSSNPSDVFRIDSQIQAAKDSKLTSLWNELIASPVPSDDKFGEFIVYLITALRDELK